MFRGSFCFSGRRPVLFQNNLCNEQLEKTHTHTLNWCIYSNIDILSSGWFNIGYTLDTLLYLLRLFHEFVINPSDCSEVVLMMCIK